MIELEAAVLTCNEKAERAANVRTVMPMAVPRDTVSTQTVVVQSINVMASVYINDHEKKTTRYGMSGSRLRIKGGRAYSLDTVAAQMGSIQSQSW